MLNIREYINPPSDFELWHEDGVYSILEKKFKQDLNLFLEKFKQVQEKENYVFVPKEKILQFPFIEFELLKDEIFARKQDLAILERFFSVQSSPKKIVLEIGGWNGWLTSRLNKWNLEVVTVDILCDENNGLKSKKNYSENDWLSIQMDVCNPSFFKKKFDVIIFNHCLQFYTEPEKLLSNYFDFLNSDGLLIILGASVYKNEGKKKKEVAHLREYYQKKYNFNIHFYPCKAYLGNEFNRFVNKNNFIFESYKLNLLRKLINILKRERHGVYWFSKTTREVLNN